MRGHNDDLIMSLAIGCWIAESNTSTYNSAQIQQSDAILKGMQVNNTSSDNTILSPFYYNNQNSFNPFIPVNLPENKFGKEIKEQTNIPGKNVRFEKTKDNNKKEFNSGYKPSGKFIYGNDVLSTIKEIL